MKRIHYLAAEIFFYSYDNYEDHLGVNTRFDKLMPEEARMLDEALDGEFDAEELAEKLEISPDELIDRLQLTKDARKIVDAKSPAEGFREAVKQSIRHAVNKGLTDEAGIDALAEQICYRAADLSFLLKEKGERLEQYSGEFRE